MIYGNTHLFLFNLFCPVFTSILTFLISIAQVSLAAAAFAVNEFLIVWQFPICIAEVRLVAKGSIYAIFAKHFHCDAWNDLFDISSATMVLRELTGYRIVLCTFFPAQISITMVAFQGITLKKEINTKTMLWPDSWTADTPNFGIKRSFFFLKLH